MEIGLDMYRKERCFQGWGSVNKFSPFFVDLYKIKFKAGNQFVMEIMSIIV